MIYAINQVVGGIAVVGGLILIFFICFFANKKTPKPEGCEDLDADCEVCPITTCLKNQSKKEDKDEHNDIN